MKYIKTLELFSFKKNKPEISSEDKHKETIRHFLRNCRYTINSDMSVDVNSDYRADPYSKYRIGEMPLKFNRAYGNFEIVHQDLMSLRLCPTEVDGTFDCSGNNLQNLKGAPKRVGGNFIVRSKGHLIESKLCLKSLEGCPKFIAGDLDIRDNGIYSFDYFPNSLGGEFLCKGNPIFYIWLLFLDKDKIDVFNDYDPIKPPLEGIAYS